MFAALASSLLQYLKFLVSIYAPASNNLWKTVLNRKFGSMEKKAEPTETKIAFMFLVAGFFETSDLWKTYLSRAPRSEWSLYIHIDPNKTFDAFPTFFHKYVLIENKRKRTVYCDDLISATIALIQEALLDTSNRKFVLLSPTHIPVKPFPELRRILLRDNSSWICFTPTPQWASITPGEERPKHHQWIVLDRYEAVRQAQLPRAPTKNMNGCEDEYLVYPPKANASDQPAGVRIWHGVNSGILRTADGSNESNPGAPLLVEAGRCSTYVEWGNYHEKSLFRVVAAFWGDTVVDWTHQLSPISYCLLRGLKDQTGFLFARKVQASARVSRRCLGPPDRQDLTVADALAELGILPREAAGPASTGRAE